MKKPFYLNTDIAEDAVTKVEFPTKEGDNINSQGLHFVPPSAKDEPPHEAIGSHTHKSDSERYYVLKIIKDDKGKIENYEWEALDPVSASTPDCNTHSVKSSNDIQIIFGVKRPENFNKDYWPADILPTVDYNEEYDLFRFKLDDNVIYTHSDFRQIFIEENSKIYIVPDSRHSSEEEKKEPGINDYNPAIDVSEKRKEYLSHLVNDISR